MARNSSNIHVEENFCSWLECLTMFISSSNEISFNLEQRVSPSISTYIIEFAMSRKIGLKIILRWIFFCSDIVLPYLFELMRMIGSISIENFVIEPKTWFKYLSVGCHQGKKILRVHGSNESFFFMIQLIFFYV